jgi:3-hydroxyacyl-[acyl-carrier-protein] dehydratase
MPRGRILSPAEVLAAVPQQEPFRFLDEILEIDVDHVVAAHRFREDADFYRGHFPGNPITPGVLLIEAMAQAGVVAHGIWLLAYSSGPEALEKLVTFFTEAHVEFSGIVRPGERVVTTGRKKLFRHKLLRSEVEMRREDGTLVCSGTLSGMGIKR